MLRHLPNAITVARIAACLPLVWLIVTGRHRLALWTALVIGLSDVLDGFLARRFGWQSRLGSLLDPAADKLFLMSAFLALGWIGAMPVWLIVLVLLRDLVIVVGALAYHRLVEPLRGEPSRLGKFCTMAQVLLVLAVLLRQGGLAAPVVVIEALVAVTALLAVASGAHYVWTWTARARAIWRSRDLP